MGYPNVGIVEVEVDGETYSGEFTYHKDVVTVWFRDERRTHTLGTGRDPTYVARQLLETLVKREKDF